MDDSHIERNKAERERLRALVGRLSEDDLSRPLGSGWTVMTALAHLAFWDRRALTTLENWERDGIAYTRVDADAINDALLIEWQANPPKDAGQQATAAAEALDGKIAGLSADLVEEILAAGRYRSIDRSLHRRTHVDEIERAISLD